MDAISTRCTCLANNSQRQLWESEKNSKTGAVMSQIAVVPSSAVRITKPESWLYKLKERENETWANLLSIGNYRRHDLSERSAYILSDVMKWLADLPENSIHAVVTDPPYGMVEYDEKNHAKLRKGRGGVWRIPPSFDGAKRKPLPRFTVPRLIRLLTLASGCAPGFLVVTGCRYWNHSTDQSATCIGFDF